MRNLCKMLVGIGGFVLLVGGCTREQEPADPVSDAPQLPSAAEPAQPLAATDSSLAIKRGIVTLSEDRATFKPCGAKDELWLLDQSQGLLTQTLIQEAQSAPVVMYVEVYGERADSSDDPQARGYAGTFVLEEMLYAGVPDEVGGCEAPPPTYIVAARGNEPFWQVEVTDAQIIWRQPEAPKEISFGLPEIQTAEGAVRYRASNAEHQVELMVYAQACRDSMSGEFFAYTAKAVLNGREFNGCARVGR